MKLNTPISRLIAVSCALALFAVAAARADGPPIPGGAVREQPCNVVVYHGPTAPPTYIDNGLPGDSPGDQRIFHFDGQTRDGSPVVMDWIMTTSPMVRGPTSSGSATANAVARGPTRKHR